MNPLLIAPICISSPVRRSGTTLLLRLLCSSSNALIYGENCANDLHFFQHLLLNKQFVFQNHKLGYQQQLEDVLKAQSRFFGRVKLPEWNPAVSLLQFQRYFLATKITIYIQRSLVNIESCLMKL